MTSNPPPVQDEIDSLVIHARTLRRHAASSRRVAQAADDEADRLFAESARLAREQTDAEMEPDVETQNPARQPKVGT